MLAFKNRFHGHNSLRYVYKNGQAVRSRTITVKYTHNKRRHTPRISVVVSKKVLKSAVGRNRIRRRLYELVRLELPKITPQTDIVILVFSSEVLDEPITQLQKTLTSLLHEGGLYKNSSPSDTL